MSLSRRTFMALSGAAAGSRVVPSFAEQIERGGCKRLAAYLAGRSIS